MNHEQTTEGESKKQLVTNVYPEGSDRARDQRHGLGLHGYPIGMLKGTDGKAFEGNTVFVLHSDNGERLVHMTGRVELNEHPAFDDHNQPVEDQMVELVDFIPEGMTEAGEGHHAASFWVKTADLIDMERLQPDHSNSDRHIGNAALEAVHTHMTIR